MRARDYLLSHFVDGEFGGVFWSFTPQECPYHNSRMHIEALSLLQP